MSQDRAEYQKAYYLANAEKARARTSAWRKANPERAKEAVSRHYAANRDAVLAYSKEYRTENAERIAAAKRTEQYRQYKSEYDKKYRCENLDRVRAKKVARRAIQLSAPGRFSAEDVRELLKAQGSKCANLTCRKPIKRRSYHIDHVVPLSKGGSNWPDNLQLLCPACNLRKQAKPPEQWAAENGLLFC
jgi:5-methylcytosine-specific restriction endonuclease McrA